MKQPVLNATKVRLQFCRNESGLRLTVADWRLYAEVVRQRDVLTDVPSSIEIPNAVLRILECDFGASGLRSLLLSAFRLHDDEYEFAQV